MATVSQTADEYSTGTMAILVEWASSTRAYRRNRLPIVKKVMAAALCNAGYSYREVSEMLGEMSYIAARDAYLSLITSLPRQTKRERSEVAIDGTDVRLGGSTFHVWLARDVGTGELMEFQASPSASAEDGARFLSAVAAQCTNRPRVRLGSDERFPRGLVNLDLYFISSPQTSFIERLGRIFRGAGA